MKPAAKKPKTPQRKSAPKKRGRGLSAVVVSAQLCTAKKRNARLALQVRRLKDSVKFERMIANVQRIRGGSFSLTMIDDMRHLFNARDINLVSAQAWALAAPMALPLSTVLARQDAPRPTVQPDANRDAFELVNMPFPRGVS